MADLVLVVGGTRGTGLLTAERLAQQGRRVRVLARDPPAAAKALGSGVEIVAGDITRPATLLPALRGARDIIFTAGVRSGQLAGGARVRATDYEGVVNTLEAAARANVDGRFVYMTSMGGGARSSVSAALLNVFKGNVLMWRRRAEARIRASGLDYAIVRAGFLVNGAGGSRALAMTQEDLPLSPRYRIARADVAHVCVEALTHDKATRVTFEVFWNGGPPVAVPSLLSTLRADLGADAHVE